MATEDEETPSSAAYGAEDDLRGESSPYGDDRRWRGAYGDARGDASESSSSQYGAAGMYGVTVEVPENVVPAEEWQQAGARPAAPPRRAAPEPPARKPRWGARDDSDSLDAW